MKKINIRQTLCPTIAAIIWGAAFTAQSMCTEFMGTFTFNALRALIGSLSLLVTVLIMNKLKKPVERTPEEKKKHTKMLLLGGLACGTLLTIASNLQQFGLETTTAGKAGFITALYMVLVPIFGLVVGKKAPIFVWISVIMSAVGLYLLCITDGFSIASGDIYVIMCAVVFALHILTIDYFTQFVDGVELSFMQFTVMTVISGICMFIFEDPQISGIAQCILPLLYVGVLSSAVAYTLQIVAQKGSNPTVVVLILSLESVFATLAAAIFLNEQLSVREYIGCILMFAAVMLAQLPNDIFKRKQKKGQNVS